MKRRYFLSCLMAAPLVSAGHAGAASVRLDAAEIEALLAGNTIIGTWSGTNYRQYYAEDGTTHYVPEGGRPDAGQWRTNPETHEYESWWRSTGWTAYVIVRTEEGSHAWRNGDRLETFSVVPGRQIE